MLSLLAYTDALLKKKKKKKKERKKEKLGRN